MFSFSELRMIELNFSFASSNGFVFCSGNLYTSPFFIVRDFVCEKFKKSIQNRPNFSKKGEQIKRI